MSKPKNNQDNPDVTVTDADNSESNKPEAKEPEIIRKDSKWFDYDDMKAIMMRVMSEWYGREVRDLETNQSSKFILYFNEDMK